MRSDKYLIVLDTNVLIKTYSGKVDYTKFSFNQNFYDISGKIEEVDAVDHISIGIPEIVLYELKTQLLSSYKKNIDSLKNLCNCRFPFGAISVPEQEEKCEEYFDRIFATREFIREIETKIVFLPFPSPRTHNSMIHRALNKLPPFEGKEKQSDKGYKDALIWESILEFKMKNPEWNIILSSGDNGFNGFLENEYKERFNGEEIKILKFRDEKTSNDILTEINNIALLLDPDTFIPQSDITVDIRRLILNTDFKDEIYFIADELFQDMISSNMKYRAISFEKVDNIEVFDVNEEVHSKIECTACVEFLLQDVEKIFVRCALFLEINVIDLERSIIDILDYSYSIIESEPLS